MFPLPVKGDQDKPFLAATGTTVPFPPTPQRNAVAFQPSRGTSRQATACPCTHPLTQHGAQSCGPAVCILQGAACRHADCQSMTRTFLESDPAEPLLTAGVRHLPISPRLLVTGPPTYSCLHRFAGAGDNYFNVHPRSDAHPLAPRPPTSQSLLPQFLRRGGHWHKERGRQRGGRS